MGNAQNKPELHKPEDALKDENSQIQHENLVMMIR